MSWLLATVYDRVLRSTEAAGLSAWRAALLAGARGEVLELGAGTGVNLAHYPAEIARIVLAEPDAHMRARLADALRLRSDAQRFELSGADATRLPYPDASFDTVVVTLVLCSVPKLDRALAEIARVLRPEGQLLYLEHVGAPHGSALRTKQRRLEPLWKRVAGGCHLTRDTLEAIERAGLVPQDTTEDRIRRAPSFIRPSVRGVALKPAASA